MSLVMVEKSRKPTYLLLIGIILIGSTLRAPLTSVGSLIPLIRDELGVSNALIGTITTLPLLAFAIISPFVPKVAKKFGMERTIFLSLILLIFGIILRSVTGVGTLFIGTAIIGIAIAFGNVLLPGFIKMSFPLRIGVVTGLYAVFMNLFGALASGLSIPIASIKNFGWQGALLAWALLVLIALIVWLPQLKAETNLNLKNQTQAKKVNVWKSLRAWQVTFFMGLQSLMFYTTLTWLPEILQVNNYSAYEAGWMLSLMQFALIPLTFIMPIIAGKMKSQSVLALITGAMFILGILGLLQGSPFMIVIAVLLLGVASGSAFSLSMMFFTLRTEDGFAASELSGMAQSFGYLLAAVGPVLFGFLYDYFTDWTAPLVMLLIVSVFITLFGYLAGKEGVIRE